MPRLPGNTARDPPVGFFSTAMVAGGSGSALDHQAQNLYKVRKAKKFLKMAFLHPDMNVGDFFYRLNSQSKKWLSNFIR